MLDGEGGVAVSASVVLTQGHTMVSNLVLLQLVGDILLHRCLCNRCLILLIYLGLAL